MKQEFLAIALSQVGYKEKGKNNTKYGEWYGLNYNPWCAMFVSWCADKVGVLDKLIPKYASSSVGYKWFEKNSFITKKPKAGDIGFLKNTGSDKKSKPASHTFIVYSVDGNTITTIEGNINDKVVKQTRKLTDSNILGFGSVEWKEETMYIDNVDWEGVNVRYISTGNKTGKILPLATEVKVLDFKDDKALISKETFVYKKYLSKTIPHYKVVSGADRSGLNIRKRYLGGIMSNPIATIKNGTKVKVYKTSGKWSKISPDSNAWCYSRYLK